MSKRQKVQYAGMEEPKFLKAFKDKVGYKEPEPEEELSAKRERLTKEFDDRELPDELPQVELGKGVSQAEAENFLQRDLEEAQKKSREEKSGEIGDSKTESTESVKKPDDNTIEPPKKQAKVAQVGLKSEKKVKKKKSKMKAVKNTKLLSFDE